MSFLPIWRLTWLGLWWCLAFGATSVTSKGKYTNAEPPAPAMYNKTVFQEDVDYALTPVSATKIPIKVTEMNLGSYSLPTSVNEDYAISKLSDTTVSSRVETSTTTFAATTTIPAVTTRRPVPTNHNIVQDFNNLLAEKKKENCDYSESSPISKICPSWENTVMNESFNPKTQLLNQKAYDRMMGWSFKDIERFIIDNQTVEKLKTLCAPGQSCLDSVVSNETYPGADFIAKHSKHICMVSSCFEYLNNYFSRCVNSTVSRDILNIIPSVCQVAKNDSSNYCFERGLRLVYMGYVVESSGFMMAKVELLRI